MLQNRPGFPVCWLSINFYTDQSGNVPVRDYLDELASKNDKDSRIKFNKIQDYIQMLSENGTRAGEPYVKHLEGGDMGTFLLSH